MKKPTILVTVIAVFALTLCLAGCSGEDSKTGSDALSLDKTVSTHGITFNISSDWSEDEYDLSNDTTVLGFSSYTSDNSALYVSVSYSNINLDETAETAFNEELANWDASENADYENIEYSEISNTTISDAECVIYEYSYNWKPSSAESYSSNSGCFAYIMAPEVHYEIQATGDDSVSVVEAILDTVSIES